MIKGCQFSKETKQSYICLLNKNEIHETKLDRTSRTTKLLMDKQAQN